MKSTARLKGVILISSGIDSPVAAYLMLNKGVELIAVHFDNQPLVNNLPLEKTKSLVRHLAKITNKKIRLYAVSHGKNQVEAIKMCNPRYRCIICRRLMFRIAEKIAKKEKCNFLVTGENLAQVASQTLINMAAASEAVKMTILRPLLCNDKEETIKIAKEIGTYEISIQAGMCCSAVPNHPATRASLEDVKREENRMNIKKLVEESVRTAEEFTF